MQSTVKTILNVVVIIVLIIWLLNAFGVMGTLNRPVTD
ncbi:MAG: Thivi_2564 family membrane protein [Bryobacteraceae bacterium]